MPEPADRLPLQPGTRLKWIAWGIHPENGDVLCMVSVGTNRCVDLVIAQEPGPLGMYHVVTEISDDGVRRRHPLHFITSYELAK